MSFFVVSAVGQATERGFGALRRCRASRSHENRCLMKSLPSPLLRCDPSFLQSTVGLSLGTENSDLKKTNARVL